MGLCGGHQKLGTEFRDPLGIECMAGTSAGFGRLDVVTELGPEKQLRNVRGHLAFADPAVTGYEIHAGVTTGHALDFPVVAFDDARTDGAVLHDGSVLGTYVHGIFESPPACAVLLKWAGLHAPQSIDYAALQDAAIERLADVVEAHLDVRVIRFVLQMVR